MREIKFKGWDKNLKKTINIKNYKMSDISYFQACGIIFLQYTGLKDKNGKEIYEGDIVKTIEGVGEIIYYDGSFTILYTKDFKYDNYPWTADLALNMVLKTKVIGNIYENPELMEKK